MTNASCVQGTAAFNQREISTSVYEFAHFDAQDARLHTVLVKYAPYQMQVVHPALEIPDPATFHSHAVLAIPIRIKLRTL
jgi:hypothetical protein